MVHEPVVSRKYSNAFLSYSAKTKRDRRTDGQTDKHSGFKGYIPLLKIALNPPVSGAYLRNEPVTSK